MSGGERQYQDYFHDILDAAIKARHFVEGMTYEQFVADDRTTFAVIRALEVIGEAAKGVPSPVRQQHPDVPWRDMAAIRDRLIHRYFGVDLRVVWRTIQEDLPDLAEDMQRIIQDWNEGQ